MGALTMGLLGLLGSLLSPVIGSAMAPDPVTPEPPKPLKKDVAFSGRGRGDGAMARPMFQQAQQQSPLYGPDFSPQRSALELMKGVKPNFNPTQSAVANMKKRGQYV